MASPRQIAETLEKIAGSLFVTLLTIQVVDYGSSFRDALHLSIDHHPINLPIERHDFFE
jgi:hypothetical protein